MNGWNAELKRQIIKRKSSFSSQGLHTGEPVGGYDELNHNSTPGQKIISDGVNAGKSKAWRAIIGGVFALAGIVDSMLYRGMKKVAAKSG